MVAADQLLQFDVRLRQAKMRPDYMFGKLAINFCGDFLQLPPVDKKGTRKSIALPINDTGYWAEDDDAAVDDADAIAKQQAQQEARQGHEIWKSV
jgi:hypothetical protein